MQLTWYAEKDDIYKSGQSFLVSLRLKILFTFFNVGPPKEDICLTTIFGYISVIINTYLSKMKSNLLEVYLRI